MRINSHRNNRTRVEEWLLHQEIQVAPTAVDLVRYEIHAEAMMRGEYGQRMRDEETDTRRKKRIETPTENQKLID